MCCSIHSGLLNNEFINEFIKLYDDLYINKSRFDLIKDKIKYHTSSNGNYINGGICDMTLYYILSTDKKLDIQNLGEPNNNIVFMNNLNNGEGYSSKNQYTLFNNIIKLIFNSNDYSIHDKINNKKFKVFNIHFQGGAKRYLNDNFKQIIINKHLNK